MKIVRESANFERGRDPKTAIGIGQRALIHKWFETYAPRAKYTIDDNLNISVEGWLDLERTQITELPDNLSVGEWLDLRGSLITELPDNLNVGGNLYLEGTQIKELPYNLNVGGSLNLGGTKITELPKSLKVKGKIYKDF
jgi:hypothetical protein